MCFGKLWEQQKKFWDTKYFFVEIFEMQLPGCFGKLNLFVVEIFEMQLPGSAKGEVGNTILNTKG